jgi:hypothetical protein
MKDRYLIKHIITVSKKKRRERYTKDDLLENSKMYSANFKKMSDAVGTPEHKKYAIIEEKLNAKDVLIRKSIGIWTTDPCPLIGGISCFACTGLWKRVNDTLSAGGKTRQKNIQVKQYGVGVQKCPLRFVLTGDAPYRN